MTTTRRGVSTYSSSSPSTSHNVTLPTGSVAGDLVFVVGCNPSFSATFTFPGTTILNAAPAIGTMHYGAFKKTLTSGDITAGYLTVAISTSQHFTAVCVGYSDAGDFGTPGTVWDKGGVSLAYTTAPLIADNSTDDVIVASVIKHSSGSQTYTSTSPTTTTLASVIQNGSGVPSVHVGVFTGTPADRTNTWGAASTNGAGFQIAVIAAAPPVVDSVTWDTGTAASSGATVTGTVSDGTLDGYATATFTQGASAAYLTWPTDDMTAYSIRYYVHTPAGWSDTAAAISHALDVSTLLPGIDLAGSFNPGQIRFKLSTSVELLRTASNLIALSKIYRLEQQVDTVSGTVRFGVFKRGMDIPLFDTGVVAASVGTSADGFRFGRVKTMASLPDFMISRVEVINSVGSWIGRHEASDPLAGPPEILGVWNGTSLDDVNAEVLGVWNGTAYEEVELLTVI